MHESNRRRRNYFRRAAGAALCLLPVAVPVLSLSYGLLHQKPATIPAMIFISLAALIAIFNFYLSFVRGLLFRLRHGTLEGYKFVSGIPVIGNILMLTAVAFGFGAIGTAL